MAVRNTVCGQKADPKIRRAADEHRRNMTEAEKLLWAEIHGSRLDGWHFRRQQVIGFYIVDFYCHAAALIIEVDGEIHQQQVEYDQERDDTLTSQGFRILRFANQAVIENISAVLEVIRMRLKAESSPSQPTGKDI